MSGFTRPDLSGLRISVAATALALLASACSGSGTAAAAAPASETTAPPECFLGLDLWDSDPALTWIQDGRVWVRTGDHQACLAFTDASQLWWGPDGRRLFLDDQVVSGDTVVADIPLSASSRAVWQHPHGDTVFMVGDNHVSSVIVGEPTTATAAILPTNIVMLASHPDGAHLAVVDSSGAVALTSTVDGSTATVLDLARSQRPIQLEFSPDASRLWILVDSEGAAQALYVDLVPVSAFLDIPELDSIVPVPEPLVPLPDLYYLDADLEADTLALDSGVGAYGSSASGFVLHPSHTDWIVLTEGRCADASSTLFVGGELVVDGIAGEAVGFFRGRGLPVLATTTAGADCGSGQLWVVDGLPAAAFVTLVADGVSSADIRDEAPDPWNPNTAPPFA